ncbi:MAG: ABC transporter substrate-binding protein [Lentimicrobiaceae bacterium]|nr:ABC transporter substrate-binding protein [Lentimicrobiaceae bacterium]MBT6963137.1 ABC transporter substrate-binding protein [Lentimicrobiaceae bacterium]
MTHLITFALQFDNMKLAEKIFNIFFYILSIIIVSISCDPPVKVDSIDDLFSNIDVSEESLVEYAIGFDVLNVDNNYKLIIYNPDDRSLVLACYYFVADRSISDNKTVFAETIDSVAVFSATQLNAYSKLNVLDKVVAISESDFIRNEEVLELFEKGKIVNLANNGNFFLEKALEIHPSIVFYSPYNLAQKHPLAETNLTMIPFFDFKETDPLGRAEWIKFTGLFFNKQRQADSIFNIIKTEYNKYKSLTSDITNVPTVFSDKYYSGQWFVPGGRSYIARLFEDAGAEYIWKENTNTASFNIDFETVYHHANDADFWRIIGYYDNDGFSYEKLAMENELYQNFDAFNNKNVVFCDSKSTSYFERGALEPHVILADLIFAFHPELLPEYSPIYYKLYK